VGVSEARRDRRLHRLRLRAREWPRRESTASLRRMLASHRTSERLLALLLMREQLVEGQPRDYLAMARRAVADPDNTCRWQALIVIGEFIPYNADVVWRVVAQYAESRSDDMRMAVTVLLLEHLLEHDFETFFKRVVKRIEAGSRYMRSLLSGCWGLTKAQEARVRRYLSEAAA
jgi:hypothetical protein